MVVCRVQISMVQNAAVLKIQAKSNDKIENSNLKIEKMTSKLRLQTKEEDLEGGVVQKRKGRND